jgi:hypothetical protein
MRRPENKNPPIKTADERQEVLTELLRAVLPFLDESDDEGALVLAEEIREQTNPAA